MANEYLKRTPTSAGNGRVFTWAGWVKSNEDNLSGNGNAIFFVASANNGSNYHRTRIGRYVVGDNDFGFNHYDGSNDNHGTGRQLRDHSSWTHYMCTVDTSFRRGQDMVKLYINGALIQWTSTLTPSVKDLVTYMNQKVIHFVGADGWTATPSSYANITMSDFFLVDGQELRPETFGFYKDGDGQISVGSSFANDIRNGQWVPRPPREIKKIINENGGFGVNGYYLPMNDSSNFGADFHCDPNSIIKLKGETLAQPRNGAPDTTDAYVSQLRSDPYAANLVLAVPGITGAPGVAYTDFSADIKGSGTNKVVTANGNAGVAATASYYGSAMSFDGTGDYFTVPANTSDLIMGSNDFTIEAWVNKNDTDSGCIFGLYDNGNDRRSYLLYSDGSGDLSAIVSTDGTSATNTQLGTSAATNLGTNQWHHCALEREGSYLRLYLNGVVAGIATDLSGSLYENTTDTPAIGTWFNSGVVTGDINGYIQDVRVYKGVAKYKGGFDVPKPYTPVGIGTWRAVSDTCKSNFATLNPLNVSADGADSTFNEFTLSEGNLRVTSTGTNHGTSANYSVSSGKWYWEYRMENFVADNAWMGVIDQDFGGSGGAVAVAKPSDSNYFPSGENVSLVVLGSGGSLYRGTSNPSGVSDTIRNGDVLGISLDLETDGNKEPRVGFYKNGVLQYTSTGSMSGNPTGFWRPAITFGGGGTGWIFNTNFGQNPSFGGRVTTGTYTDSNGRGLFKYEPPSGFLALCKDNLPEPTIKDPGKHFKALIWEGENTTQRHECGFKPDLVWIKNRDYTNWNSVNDVIRGPYVELATNSTNGDRKRETADGIRSFFDTGFTSGADDNTGGGDYSYVGWAWKGGGDPVPNTKGSLVSQVSANPTAGFSIVGWTGDGTTNETVGHGLGKAPSFIILKPRTEERNWLIWHEDMAGNDYAALFTNGAPASARFGPDAPTSDVFGVYGGQGNRTGCEFVAYCWTEIEGYSRIGEWSGNASTNGPYVYCGFKPAWMMYKRIDTTGDWNIVDNARSSENPVRARTFANLSNAESHLITVCDFTSNGFKIKTDAGSTNAQGGDYIFVAFAETPFKYANAK